LAAFLPKNLEAQSPKPLEDYFSGKRYDVILDDLHCFSDEELSVMSEEIRDGEDCQVELELYKEFAEENFEKKEETSFYQEPSIIIGGVIFSLMVGSMLGYMVGHNNQ